MPSRKSEYSLSDSWWLYILKSIKNNTLRYLNDNSMQDIKELWLEQMVI